MMASDVPSQAELERIAMQSVWDRAGVDACPIPLLDASEWAYRLPIWHATIGDQDLGVHPLAHHAAVKSLWRDQAPAGASSVLEMTAMWRICASGGKIEPPMVLPAGRLELAVGDYLWVLQPGRLEYGLRVADDVASWLPAGSEVLVRATYTCPVVTAHEGCGWR